MKFLTLRGRANDIGIDSYLIKMSKFEANLSLVSVCEIISKRSLRHSLNKRQIKSKLAKFKSNINAVGRNQERCETLLPT